MSELPINDHAEYLAGVMKDWNYMPMMGALEIDGAKSLEEIKQAIKKAFPKTEPSEESFVVCPKEEMFDELRHCFANDENPTRNITALDIPKEAVKEEQEAFLQRIETYIKAGSEIVGSSIDGGLPTVYVFWRFAFVIFNKGGKSLFLFGAASD